VSLVDPVKRLQLRSSEILAASPWARWLLIALPAVVLVALFAITDIRGVDFGDHWDEVDWQVQPVRDMVNSGLLLPRASLYPTFGKWLTLLPAIPSAIGAALKKGSTTHDVQAAMMAKVNPPSYLLTVRCVYICVSALAIAWVYAAALALRRPWWEAFLAAAGLGLSWQYAYHARWVATDCLLVQFSALTLFMLALFSRQAKLRWLRAAAVTAGLATGSKFPGGVLLLPIVLASVTTLPHRSVRDLPAQLLRAVSLCAIAFGAYLLTTPATLLDPFNFADQLTFIAKYYEKGHWGYTVSGPAQHWRLVLTYFAVSFFSPHLPIAVALFACAVLGAVVWIRNDRPIGPVLVAFPVLFLAYFCGKYRAMIVRNYLFITPFLCILMARGVGEIFVRLARWQRLRFPWASAALAAVLMVALTANAVWLVQAGESIRHFDPARDVAQAVTYVSEHPQTRFLISNKVRALAAAQHLGLPTNVTKDRNFDQVIFFAEAEGPDGFHMKTNDPWMAKAVFGQREIDYGWYATWTGRDRVVAMTAAKARYAGVRLAQ
jgi:Dolichyl-phosphate-mannose-protein mannosyltransferase